VARLTKYVVVGRSRTVPPEPAFLAGTRHRGCCRLPLAVVIQWIDLRGEKEMTMRKRFAVLIGVLAAGLLAGLGVAGQAVARPERPTVVLVHGAFAESSSWNGVIERLQRHGYPVVAVANPLRGVGSDAAYLKDVLAGIDGPVVLAGHSYGGQVMSVR
jgi:pimeloyl-ACP methyl ester carboxylesterase